GAGAARSKGDRLVDANASQLQLGLGAEKSVLTARPRAAVRRQALAGAVPLSRTTSQLTSAMRIVISRMTDLLKSTRVSSKAQMAMPRIGNSAPPGSRK